MAIDTAIQPAGKPYRWTVNKYHQLIQAGILGKDDNIELINGEILTMPPINPPHAAMVDTLVRLFYKQVPEDVLVRVQNPVTILEDSEPEPDIALVKMADHRYKERHPGAEDILLLVEVADSSARNDRKDKIPVYAKAGISEVWLIDLAKRQVCVHLGPQENSYKTIKIFQNEFISPVNLPEVKIHSQDLF